MQKHIDSTQHKESKKWKTKSDLRCETYKEIVVQNTGKFIKT